MTSTQGDAKRFFRGAISAIVILHVAICLSSLWHASATYDEPDYIGAGRYILETGNWRFTSAEFHPPLSFYLNSIPLLFRDFPDELWNASPSEPGGPVWYDIQIGNRILSGEFGDPLVILRLARLPSVILSAALLLIVACWTRALAGPVAGISAGFLYALMPTIIADARLATTDLLFAFSIVGIAASAWAWRETCRRRYFVLTVLAMAAALGAKPNGILWIPAGLALLLPGLVRNERGRPRRFAFLAGAAIVLPFIVLWGLYGFKIGAPRPPNAEGMTLAILAGDSGSGLFRMLYRLTELPWPMPQYAVLMASKILHAAHGMPAFLMGEFNQRGWWYYFPIALLIKTPLPTLVASLVGLGLAARRRDGLIFILGPIAATLIPAIFSPLNIGIRHILPVYPLLAVAGGIAVTVALRHPYGRIVTIAGAIWLAIGAWQVHPSHLSYFNEIAGGIEGGERWLSDSNICWGEDFARLGQWQKENGVETVALAHIAMYDPMTYGVNWIPYTDTSTGWIAIETMMLQYAPLQSPNLDVRFKGIEPAARIGGGIRIFILPD